jgi:hypothetical protein
MGRPVGGESLTRRKKSGQIQIRLQLEEGELKRVRKQLRALGTDSPEIRGAFERAVDEVLIPALKSAAPGSMGSRIKRGAVSRASLGTAPRVTVRINHPGAAAYEFGRKIWYRGWKGRARGKGSVIALGGRPFRSSRGQPPRPWIGIKGGGALAAARPALIEAIERGIEQTWERLGGEQ